MTKDNNRRTDYRYFRLADIFLILVIVFIIMIAVKFSNRLEYDSSIVNIVTPDSSFAVALSTDTLFFLQGRMGNIELQIENNAVRIVEAPCPGQDCVNSGWIREQTESIICLPSGISVHIRGSDDRYTPDAFTY